MPVNTEVLEPYFNTPAHAYSPELGVIKLTGQDTIKLLQGQTTSDFNALTSKQGLFGALCNPKGRIIVNFFALAQDHAVLLVLNRALVDKVITHLKKYAVFFKVSIENATEEFSLSESFSPAAELDSESTTFSIHQEDAGISIITATAPMIAKLHLCAASAQIKEQNASRVPLLRLCYARPLINLEQSETILPQWLNMQSSGGVSFTKGCYTGQEIVARMQYRGKSKKQLALVLLGNKLVEESKLLDQHAKETIQVLNIASSENFSLAQVILNSSPEETGPITLDGQEVKYIPLPYAID